MFRLMRKSVLILLILITSAFPFEPLFDSHVDYPMMGLYISSSIRADFTNDGFVDFVCATNSYYDGSLYNQLKYYVNNGDGTFQDPIDIPAGVNHSVMLPADFNNDGWEDFIAVSNYPASPNFYIYIFMNQGNGNLAYLQVFPKVNVPYLAVMDVNNDGFDDILQMDNSSINVMFSNGDGSFTYGTSGEEMVKIPMDAFGQMRPWDVNKDSYPDLLIQGTKTVTPPAGDPYSQSFVATYVNNADTSFSLAAEYLYGSVPGELITSTNPGYFNSDSEKDILVKDNQDVWSILIGNDDGSFSLHESPVIITTALPITHGDVNGDGLADILISDTENASISVILNNSDTEISFSEPAEYSGKWNDDPNYPRLGTEDLNSDGYDDIFLSNYSLSTIINHGDGTFPILQQLDDMGTEPFDMVSEDFNRDGYPDILTIDADRLYVSYNDGAGNFLAASTISTGLEWQNGIFSGDFNADEIPDFAVAKGLKLFYGLEEGGFQPGPDYGDSLSGLSAMDGAAAYLNDDEYIDFVVYWFGSIRVVLSDPTGSYQLESYVFSSDGFSQITDLDIADIDNDNDLDILFGFIDGIYINFNDGAGGFHKVDTLTSAGGAGHLTVADFNDDDFMDIAAAQTVAHDHCILIYVNDGSGNFSAGQPFGQVYNPYYKNLTSTDMDNDGDADIVATLTVSNEMAIFLNEGNGTFPEIQYYTGGDQPVKMVISDFDKDSTMDVAILSAAPSRDLVYIFPNTGQSPTSITENASGESLPGSITLEQNYPNPFNPRTVISYQLTVNSEVDLSIYNVLGQKVTTLVSGKQGPGAYKINWNGVGFSSGVYFYQLTTAASVKVRKMMLLK